MLVICLLLKLLLFMAKRTRTDQGSKGKIRRQLGIVVRPGTVNK